MIPIKIALSFAFAVLGLGLMSVGLFSWLSTKAGQANGFWSDCSPGRDISRWCCI